ncbi:hypothetical protein ACTSKR_14695 [Chitinibacteraceae bacterium HSL-7]
MMRRRLYLMSALCAGYADAGQLDALPSCYAAVKVGVIAPAPHTELFVAVDQTTMLDDGLKQGLASQTKPFVRPGGAFTVMQFSAYAQGRYLAVLSSGALEAPLPQAKRDDTGKNVLMQLDRCLGQQRSRAMQLAGGALKSALAGSSASLGQSDVLASLKDLSAKVRQSKASERVVLISSDMLENSSISSFYAKNSVRKIDAATELAKVASAGLFGDFGGARVYVQGAGLMSEAGKAKGVYRDPKTMAALQQFWAGYFQKSNAKLVEFGQPALLNRVQ